MLSFFKVEGVCFFAFHLSPYLFRPRLRLFVFQPNCALLHNEARPILASIGFCCLCTFVYSHGIVLHSSTTCDRRLSHRGNTHRERPTQGIDRSLPQELGPTGWPRNSLPSGLKAKENLGTYFRFSINRNFRQCTHGLIADIRCLSQRLFICVRDLSFLLAHFLKVRLQMSQSPSTLQCGVRDGHCPHSSTGAS